MSVNADWKKKAVELAVSTNKSWRKIAKEVGKPKSTVSDYLRAVIKGAKIQEVDSGQPKILFFDIETSPITAYVWGLFKQNVSLSQIKEDWYIICWSAKWLGKDEVLNSSVHHYPKSIKGRYRDNELKVVKEAWKVLDEADIVVAHNLKAFDKKKINAKFLEYGLPEPSPYKVVDTLLIAKGNFKLTSNKLDYITKLLEGEGKHSTDMQLWVDCMNDDVQQLDYMQEYCDQDVRELESIYLKLRHWDKNAPNLSLYYDDDKPRCNSCGSSKLSKLENKVSNTNLSSFDVFRCDGCGKVLRGRDNNLDKSKRKSLLMNVV